MSNTVVHIRADVHSLCIRLSEAADGAVFTVHAAVPTVCGNPAAEYTPGRTLCSRRAAAKQETEVNFST